VDKALSCVVRPDDNAIKYACQGNREVDWETRRRIIDKLLKAKASINVGFCSACCSGDRRCVDYLIQRGANAWNQGLESACYGNPVNMEVVNLLIERGANNWDQCLDIVTCSPNWNLILLFDRLGARRWDWALRNACRNYRFDIIHHILFRKFPSADAINEGLSAMFSIRSSDRLDLEAVERYAALSGAKDWNRALVSYAFQNHPSPNTLEWLKRKGASDWDTALGQMLDHKWTVMDRIRPIAWTILQGARTPRTWRYPQQRPVIQALADNGVPVQQLVKSIGGMHKFTKNLAHQHLLIRKYLRCRLPPELLNILIQLAV
jgi:hypothetical protein